jgi:predicted ArsR family transcriptional regulator
LPYSGGAPELTPLYCQMDDLLFEALPPEIRWERTKTLGRGDEICDFRWTRQEVKQQPGLG